MTEIIQGDMEEIKINTNVLVIGGGYAGLYAAKRISESGYPVVLVESGNDIGIDNKARSLDGLGEASQNNLKKLADDVNSDNAIDVLTNSTLAGTMGTPGDFTVRLAAAEAEKEKKVGAIVVATEFSTNPLHKSYQIDLSEKVISLSQLENLVGDSDGKALENKTVAFMAGFAKESNPVIMERFFRSLLSVEAIEGCTPYVYTGNLKVASDGLERIFLKSRDQGATYFKLTEMPVISPDGNTVSFKDPVTRKNMELDADLIVIDEETIADGMNVGLAEMLRIDLGPDNFLQTDNVHRFPVKSNREGIFVVGGSRDVQTMPAAIADVENAVLEIKGLLNGGKITVPKNKAILDTGKCTFCITCYRCCPHGAIYWDIDNKPVISSVACQGCGICASECPMDAIQIGDYNDSEIIDKIKAEPAVSGSPRILAFCCQNSAYEAGLMADAFGMELPANLQIIKVPCAGKVDIDYILNAFVEGADGVMVMACHTGNCKSEKGNTFAGWRVEDAQRMLEEIGLEKERLSFITLASNMGSSFSSAAKDMEKFLNGLT